MKVSRKEGTKERQILSGLITNTSMLGRFASKWDGKLFQSSWANIVAEWCFKYYDKYQKAPRKHISHLYEAWAADTDDQDSTKLVERFLTTLSGEWTSKDKLNVEYLIDIAAAHFNEVRLRRLAEGILGDIESGEAPKAEALIGKWGRVDTGTGSAINVFQDMEAMKATFTEGLENLIKYPGALGTFFDEVLVRDSFVCFEGPEKRGKTWWLIDLAWRAALQRRKTAYFAVGDMSQNQMMRRFITRATHRPWKVKKYNYPLSVSRDSDSSIANVELEERKTSSPLTYVEGQEAMERIMKKKIRSKIPMLKLSCHPNSTMTVAGIDAILRMWERTDGWIADVVVIDYADILAGPLSGAAESRDQVNATWKQLRALSQARHNLVVTATQTDARSYQASVIDRSHFSEDKRKMAHVTAMIGLNASEEEKELGLMRLNYVVLREGEFSSLRCVHVAGSLAVGNPAIRSTF